ncbi:MAG: GtrA family protein [Verrucomicrobia bacterium]|nr:GtrA family protein [Verrucomicrobiota bacterium]
MTSQLFRFGLVGLAAMATHFLIVRALVPTGFTPLVANVLGFIGAFQISYWGHSLFTFRGHGNSRADSMARFLFLATLSFLLNEGLYACLLRYTNIPYDQALVIVLLAVSALTLILSRTWAFRAPPEPS